MVDEATASLPAGKEIREESWRKDRACGGRFSIPRSNGATEGVDRTAEVG